MITRACPAFPDFQDVSGSPNRLQGEPCYSDRPSGVKRRPGLHFSAAKLGKRARQSRGELSARLFTKPILSGPFEYYFFGEQS